MSSTEEIGTEPDQPVAWSKPLPSGVPPSAFWGEDDLLYHRIEVVSEGGTKHVAVRRLATTLEEARDARIDYFHGTLGLIWEGYKLATDRSAESRVRDLSESRLRPGSAIPA